MGGPRLAARRHARQRPTTAAAGEARFHGFGLLALPLESGDVIAFRHFTSSSLGPPFTCLWHRDPAGRWTCHVNVAPARSAVPFHAPALHAVCAGDVAFRWRGRDEFTLLAPTAGLQLAVRLSLTTGTRALAAATALLPSALWRAPATARALGRALGLTLRTGPLSFAGHTPTGHAYRIQPAAFWHVAAAAALRDGRDLGGIVRLPESPVLGELALPRRALAAALTEEYRAPGA